MANPEIYPYQDGRTSTSFNRETQMRRDNDTVKLPKIGLYDIDYGIYYHLKDVWKPQIIDNDVAISVPVMFSSGEKWAQIRANGFLRDKDKKVQSPLMVIKRNNIEQDSRLSLFPGQVWGGNSTLYPSTKVIPYKRSGMQFDKISGQYQTKESIEYYIVDLPEYIRVTYDLILWTDLQEQMNVLIQGLIPMSGHMWGDFYKFRTQVQSITPETVNVPGEDRLIKTTVSLYVDGYLRNEFEYQSAKIQKMFSVKKVRFMEEGSEQILFNQINDINEPSVENTANIPQTELKRIL